MPKILILLCLLQSFALMGQNSRAFKHYKIDINSSLTDFFGLIDEVEIIRLEETDASLLSTVDAYFPLPKGEAIVDKKTNQIIIFDFNGDYRSNINRYGKGPNEYQGISSAWVRNGQIELFSGTSRSINVFNLQGDYLKTIPSKYSEDLLGGTMLPFENGYLLHLLQPSMYDDAEYALLRLNPELETVHKIPSKVKQNPFPLNLGKRFAKLEGEVLYKKVLNDSLFLIRNNRIIPLMRFDFGEDWVWSDRKHFSSIRAASDAATKSEKVVEVLPDVGKDYILLTYFAGLLTKVRGYVLIDRDNPNVLNLDMRRANKENYLIHFLQWQEDQLIASLPVDQIEEFVSNLGSGQYRIAGGVQMEELQNYENPVLLKIKMK